MPTDTPAHWPRPNGARTKCLECGRLIAKAGNGWIHRPYPTRGRPPGKPRNGFAAPHIQAWHRANDEVDEAMTRRDDAFIGMASVGMLGAQIADATGLTRAGVAIVAERLGVRLRKDDTPSSTRAVIKKRARMGSRIFG